MKKRLINLRKSEEFKRLREFTLNVCKNKNVFYVPNTGNWGDGLINIGTTQFLNDCGINFSTTSKKAIFDVVAKTLPVFELKPLVLIHPGCGNWNMRYFGAYSFIEKVQFLFSDIIIFPTTFELGSIRGSETKIHYFSRDKNNSSNFIKSAKFCHDMSLFLNLQIPAQPDKIKNGYFFRTDKEQHENRTIPTELSLDISSLGNEKTPIKAFFQLIENFENVHTDRLHVAIASTMLGKNTKLHRGSSWKSYSVFKSSLEPNYKNVEFCS